MKNQMAFLFIAMLSLATIAACGKKDENQVAVVPAPAVTYVMQGNQCIQSGTTTVVPITSCPGATAGGYYVSGNQCLQTGTNIVIGPAPCPVQTGYPQPGYPQVGYPQPGYPASYPPGYNQFPVGYTPGIGGQIGASIGIGPIGINIGGTIGVGAPDNFCRGWFFQPGVGWGVCHIGICHGLVMYGSQGPVYCP